MTEKDEKPTAHQIRLLKRFVAGECPSISGRVFEELCSFPGMPNALQRESASGADTRDGFILTSLHAGRYGFDDTEAVKQWLIDEGYLSADTVEDRQEES